MESPYENETMKKGSRGGKLRERADEVIWAAKRWWEMNLSQVGPTEFFFLKTEELKKNRLKTKSAIRMMLC